MNGKDISRDNTIRTDGPKVLRAAVCVIPMKEMAATVLRVMSRAREIADRNVEFAEAKG